MIYEYNLYCKRCDMDVVIETDNRIGKKPNCPKCNHKLHEKKDNLVASTGENE
jgi:uncharacterized paraquat-inducible protein A